MAFILVALLQARTGDKHKQAWHRSSTRCCNPHAWVRSVKYENGRVLIKRPVFPIIPRFFLLSDVARRRPTAAVVYDKGFLVVHRTTGSI